MRLQTGSSPGLAGADAERDRIGNASRVLARSGDRIRAGARAAPAPVPEVTTSVTAVSNEISTPAVLSPDKVIATLRPKFNACFADGLKKDPKTGSVTLSAKIDKDGKVSTVTPKMLTGFSPTVVEVPLGSPEGRQLRRLGRHELHDVPWTSL